MVNFYPAGVFLITSLLQSVILQSANPRIVFVSSEAHKVVTPQDLFAFEPRKAKSVPTFLDHVKIYGISKLALHLFAQYLAESFPGNVCFFIFIKLQIACTCDMTTRKRIEKYVDDDN